MFALEHAPAPELIPSGSQAIMLLKEITLNDKHSPVDTHSELHTSNTNTYTGIFPSFTFLLQETEIIPLFIIITVKS